MLGGASRCDMQKYLHLLLQALQSFLCGFILWVYPAKESFFLIGARTQGYKDKIAGMSTNVFFNKRFSKSK
jgi:hypothetical protein